MDRDELQRLIDHDVALLKQLRFRPGALVRRLMDARRGCQTNDGWPEFSVPGRGISHAELDRDRFKISLEFVRAADGQAPLEKLKELLPQLKAIETVDGHSGVRLSIIIYLHKTEPAATP